MSTKVSAKVRAAVPAKGDAEKITCIFMREASLAGSNWHGTTCNTVQVRAEQINEQDHVRNHNFKEGAKRHRESSTVL